MKKSEKTLVGVGALAGGLAIFMLVGMPQWDGLSSANSQISSLKDEAKNLETQKAALNSQIAMLEKNTDLPPGIIIRTYNESNRAQIIKQFLDHVVILATGAGNKFISLAPSEAAPIVSSAPAAPTAANGTAAKPALASAQSAANQASATATATSTEAAGGATATTTGPDGKPVEAASTAILTTFGYDLSVRGTYDSLQRFLKVMGEQKELLEITTISLTNEANGLIPASSSSEIVDPAHPIRLTARIRMALQPKN